MSRCFTTVSLCLDPPAAPGCTLHTQPDDEEFPVVMNATFVSDRIGVIHFAGMHLVWREFVFLASVFFSCISLRPQIKGDGGEKI